MSNQAKPYEELNIFNRDNFPSSSTSANSLDYPVAQGVASLIYGVIWGDGTYQNSATGGGGGAPLTVQDGTVVVNNVTDINVSNGTLVDNGGGSVSVTTGAGVTNPMTADLDAAGFSIFNLPELNDSAAQLYFNQGAVAAGNGYLVAAMDPRADGEASILVVSRCLDAGFKQTTIFTVSAFADRAHVNVHANLCESDTPIWDSIKVADDGSSGMYVYLNCVTPSTTWELRTYNQQDGKGTIGTYGSSWKVVTPATVIPAVVNTYVEQSLSFFAGGQNVMSGNLDVKNAIACSTLTASSSVSTNQTNTNLIADNGGVGTVGFLNSINMNSNDIQSANLVGALGFVGAALNITIPIGHPTNGPIFVDTATNTVGVGIPAPQDILDVAKSVTITGATDPRLQFFGATQSAVQSQIISSDTLLNGADLNFFCKENGGSLVNKMTIFQDGRVRLSLNRIENMADPINVQDAATKSYVDSSIPSLTGYVQNPMVVDLDAGTFQINNMQDPSLAQDAATKAYVDASIPSLAGFVTNPMTADLDGGAFNLFNIQGVSVNDFVKTGGNIEGGSTINAQQSIFAGDSLNTPGLQASVNFKLPNQIASASGIMPLWLNGYLSPQSMSAGCVCGESVTAPGANKLDPVSLISSSVAAYVLMSTSPSGNILLRIPPALNGHTFNVQMTGEWDGSTIGGNGNSYTYLRLDLDPTADIIGLNTGQAIDGARYPLSMNFVGQLREGDYAVFVGHYDLGSTRQYKGRIDITYIGNF